jgi:CHAT domain-containing protein
MGEFYGGIRQGASPAEALQQAQRRIREMTNSQVSQVLNHCLDSQPCGAALREACQRYQAQAAQNPEAQPFHDAYWWAAFTVNGLSPV